MDTTKKKPPEIKSLFKLYSKQNEEINKSHIIDLYTGEKRENFYSVFDSQVSLMLTPINENLNFKKVKEDVMRSKLTSRIKRSFDFVSPNKKVDKTNIPRLKSSKLRIYPNEKQKELFSECFKVHEHYYNLAIDIINKDILEQNKSGEIEECVFCKSKTKAGFKVCEKHLYTTNFTKLTAINIRNQLIIKDPDLKSNNLDWILNVPYDTRERAIRIALTSLKSAITNFKNKNTHKFNLGKLKLDRISKIFEIDKRAINVDKKGIYIFERRLKQNKYLQFYRDTKPLKILSDVKIISKNKKYYISIPHSEDFQDIKKKKHKFISLDPGERTFLTGFDNTNLTQFGSDTRDKVLKYQKKIDIYSNLIETKHLRKNNIKNKKRKLHSKITSTIQNMHNQVSSYLCKTYENIILPEFETSNIVKKSFNKKLNRNLNCLSHYKFKNKLKGLAPKYGSKIFIVSESCTTMSCGKCGHHTKIGSSEIYNCGSCDYNNISRDGNAARNIVMKVILNHPDVTSPLKSR